MLRSAKPLLMPTFRLILFLVVVGAGFPALVRAEDKPKLDFTVKLETVMKHDDGSFL